MASTRYIVAATANHAERVMSNLKSAKKAADERVTADGGECTVVTVSTGRISYTAKAPLSKEGLTVSQGEFDALLAEVQAEGEAQVEQEPVAVAPASRKALRQALGESAVKGWELLYDKPRQRAQVGRQGSAYALICVDHQTVHTLERLVDERAARKAGGWCAECAH